MDLERASVTGRRSLATSEQELKSERDINAEVQELELEGSAQAHCRFELDKPFKHWATLIHHRVAKPYVHQSSQQVHTSP